MKKSEVREIIREELEKLNERKIKGYTLVMIPKVGDKVEMKTSQGGIQGIVYQVATGGHTFKLKDDYGNKNTKDFNTKDFKKAKIVRENETKLKEWWSDIDGMNKKEVQDLLIRNGFDKKKVKRAGDDSLYTLYSIAKRRKELEKESIKEGTKIYVADERLVGKFSIIVMQDPRTSTMRTAIMKKSNIDRFNRNKQADIDKLWALAIKYKGKEIKEEIRKRKNG